jgi:hypothetical protein
MKTREQQWSDQYGAYLNGERILLPRQVNEEFASVCLLLRDAAWASGLFPTSSMGRLGITTSPVYEEWIVGRSAWLGVDEKGQLSVTYQEDAGRTQATHNVAAFGPDVLNAAATWLRGESAYDG